MAPLLHWALSPAVISFRSLMLGARAHYQASQELGRMSGVSKDQAPSYTFMYIYVYILNSRALMIRTPTKRTSNLQTQPDVLVTARWIVWGVGIASRFKEGSGVVA